MSFTRFDQMFEAAKGRGPVTIAVAAAADRDVLQAIQLAEAEGIARSILVGDAAEVSKIAESLSFDLGRAEVRHVADPAQAALEAARAVRTGEAQVLMKGMVSSGAFLKAVLNPEAGLRKGKLLSHLAVFDVPGFERLVFVTDGGMNLYPDVGGKMEILKNAVSGMQALGFKEVKVAVLAAIETVNTDMPPTIDAAAIAQAAERGQLGKGVIVDGPLALDNAINEEAAIHKGIKSPVAGKADLLLVPDIEAGNILGKSLVYFARGTMAGLILGAAAPVVLVSRADPPRAKLVSIAMASLLRG